MTVRLQQAIKRPDSRAMSPSEAKALSILIFIVSLLGENCNFDNLRKDHPGSWSLRSLVAMLIFS